MKIQYQKKQQTADAVLMKTGIAVKKLLVGKIKVEDGVGGFVEKDGVEIEIERELSNDEKQKLDVFFAEFDPIV